MSIASLNNNSSMVSDVLEQGDSLFRDTGQPVTYDDYIAADGIPVIFYNRPYSRMTATSPGKPFGDFLVTRYTVEWVRTDSASSWTLPPYEAALGIQVPTGQYIEGQIMLVTYENKLHTTLYYLNYLEPLFGEQITMNANITFYGHEIGTNRETAIEASLGVVFVDLVQKSDR
jgi:hypothetical protein